MRSGICCSCQSEQLVNSIAGTSMQIGDRPGDTMICEPLEEIEGFQMAQHNVPGYHNLECDGVGTIPQALLKD